MFNSKPLKTSRKEKYSKLYLWWIESDLRRYYHRFLYTFIENPIFQVKRLIQWYLNVFRYDYDFDAHCLFAIIEYKLQRVEKDLINGNSIQEPKDMKALKLAIKLAGRLKDDKYELRAHHRLNDKWGELTLEDQENKDGPIFCTFKRTKVENQKDEEKEYEDTKKEYEDTKKEYGLAHSRMRREERWLYDILRKYLRLWWD